MKLELCVVGMLAVTVAGCKLDDPCPGGQKDVRGVCVVADASGPVICEPTGDFSDFGKSCTDQTDCACPTGTCNIGVASPYCTEVNCMRTDADGGVVQVCPPGWTCFPVPVGTSPGVESVCLKP